MATVADGDQLGERGVALVACELAAGGERAARRVVPGVGRLAGQRGDRPAPVGVEDAAGTAADLGCRDGRAPEHRLGGRTDLGQPARRRARRCGRRTWAATPRSWVMKMKLLPSLVAQVAQQLEDLGLHRDVEGGRRLVGDDQRPGDPAIAMAIITRWRSPPDSSCG